MEASSSHGAKGIRIKVDFGNGNGDVSEEFALASFWNNQLQDVKEDIYQILGYYQHHLLSGPL